MARPKASKIKASRARNAVSVFRQPGTPTKASIMPPVDTIHFKQGTIPQKRLHIPPLVFCEEIELAPAKPKKRKTRSSSRRCTQHHHAPQLPCDSATSTLPSLERKYQAIMAYCLERQKNELAGRKRLPSGFTQDLLHRFKLGMTERHFLNLVKHAENGESLLRKKGSGHPLSVLNQENLNKIDAIIKKYKGCISRKLLHSLINKNGIKCGYTSVKRALAALHYVEKKRRVVPILKDSHIKDRLEWCKTYTENGSPLYDPSTVFVMLDEKYFRACIKNRTALVKDTNTCAPFLKVHSKLHPPQEMFLGALACPRPMHGYHGHVGLWPVGKMHRASKKSKYHKKGEMYLKSCSMNKKLFIEYVTSKVIPKVIHDTKKWVNKIVIQFDNAGGHGGSHDRSKRTKDLLYDWVQAHQEKLKEMTGGTPPTIEFVSQPANSPDLNVLDLGAWWSLDTAVKEVRTKPANISWNTAVREAVQKAWDSWVCTDSITRIFETHKKVMEEVLKVNGDNTYTLPHFRDDTTKTNKVFEDYVVLN